MLFDGVWKLLALPFVLIAIMAFGLWVLVRPRQALRRITGRELPVGRETDPRIRIRAIAVVAGSGLTLLVLLAAAVYMSTR